MNMSSYGYSGKYAVKGKVVERYTLDKGNLAVLVEDEEFNRRYLVEFRSGGRDSHPSLDNLFGLLSDRYAGKGDYLERLLTPGSYLDVTVEGKPGPIRQAHYLNAVYPKAPEEWRQQREHARHQTASYIFHRPYNNRATAPARSYQ